MLCQIIQLYQSSHKEKKMTVSRGSLFWAVAAVCFIATALISSVAFGQAIPNAPVISKIGGKSVIVGETLYTNGGQQGQSSISLSIEGFSEANATVKIYNSSTLVATTAAQSNGAFQTSVTVGEGTYSYTATATNAGGTSPASEPAIETKVDTTPPSITAYNRSRWAGDSRWVRNELNSLYAIVSDTGSAVLNSGIDFSNATGQIEDQTDGSFVPGTITTDSVNRIDFNPTGGFASGSFTDTHYYIMTLGIRDKAGNYASDDNDFNIDYTWGYSVEFLYIYDPDHEVALQNGELASGEPGLGSPTPNLPKTVSGHGDGWVDYYPDMHIYTNPTKIIAKIRSNLTGDGAPPTSPWMGGPHLANIRDYIDTWVMLSNRNVHNNGLIDSNGLYVTDSMDYELPKERVRFWLYLRDSAYNRSNDHNCYFYTKSGAPPEPTITHWGADTTNFSATHNRIINPLSGTIAESSNNMVAFRYGSWPGNVNWKVVVPPSGTSYSNTSGYETGDTFIDTNNNWQWDAGEPYKNFTKPATSDGRSFTILNPLDQTIDSNGIFAGYAKVYDPSTGDISNRTHNSHNYYVDVTYPWIDNVNITPSSQSGGITYASLTDLPEIVVDINDSPFNQTYNYAFTFDFEACKIELLDSSNTVINPSDTGTFAKDNLTVSYAKGELDLSTVSGITQGEYTVRFTLVDRFGNTTVDDSTTLVIDGDVPTVTAVIPAPGAMASSLSNFQATVNDINILGEQGSGVMFGSGDQAIGDASFSQFRPLKVMGTASASAQELVITGPLKSHTGADLAVLGQSFEAWPDGSSLKADTVTITDISGDQITLSGTGSLEDATSYNILFEIPYYHTSNGINRLGANPINPIVQDGFYVFQVQAVDKASNASITTSSYEFGTGQPTLFTNATGTFAMTATPETGLAGEPVEIQSDVIMTSGGTPVFDGTFVTVSTTFGTITEGDADTLTDGHQVKSQNGRVTFHVLSTSVGSGTVHAEVGDAYSQPDAQVQVIPNYPYGTIALQADKTSLVADGSGQVALSSSVAIKDMYNNLITAANAPHNQFVVTAPGFTILGADANPGTPEHEIVPDANGFLHISLQAGTTARSSTVTISSVTQSGSPLAPTASGSIGLTLQPGAPGQPIELSTSDNTLIAQSTETTVVVSDVITDTYGNIVANGTQITVSTDNGFLISGGSPVTQMTASTSGGVITVEVSAQNTTVGSATITAQSADQSQSGSIGISFVPDDPFGAFSLDATPSPIVADGSSQSMIITPSAITDQYGNPVGSGVTFTCSVSAGNIRAHAGDAWQAGPVSVVSTGSGMLSFEIRSSTVLETAVVTAAFDATGAQGTVSVPFIAGSADQILNLQSDTSQLIAGSSDTATITGDVHDAFGHPVANGTQVTATVTYADLSQDILTTTTTDGSFVFTVAGTDGVIGQCTIEAECQSVTDSLAIEFVPDVPEQNFSLSAFPSSLLADGISTSIITSSVILDAYDNTVAQGELIAVTISDGSILTPDADAGTPEHEIAVGGNGSISFELQSSTVAHTVSVTAQSVNGNAMGSTTVTLYAGVPAGTISLTATPDELIANSGSTAQVVSGVIIDSNGNTVAQGTEITVETDLGSIGTADANTGKDGIQVLVDAYGKIQFELSSSDTSHVPLGTATITVYSDGLPAERASGSVQATLTHGDPHGSITLHALSTPLVADGASQTVIQSDPIHDLYGNPMTAGVLVTVSTSSGTILEDVADDVAGKQAQTTASGTISFTLQAGTQAGVAEVTALSYIGTAFGRIYVQIDAGVPTGAVTLTANPDTLVLDGVSESTVTSGIIEDMYGNVVTDGTLVTVDAEYGSITTPDAAPLEPLLQVATSGGTITFTVSSAGAIIDTSTVSAQSVQGDASGSTLISFIAGPPSGTVALQASPSVIVADPLELAPVSGVQTVTTIETSAFITDAGGNIVSDGEMFTLHSTGGRIIGYDNELPFDDDPAVSGIQIASSGGTIRFKLSSSGFPTGNYTVYVSSVSGTAAGSQPVTFTDTGVIDSISVVLDAERPDSNRYIPWNIIRGVTLICFDQMGNSACGDTVTLSIKQNNAAGTLSGYAGYPGSGSATQWSGQTDADGVFMVTYTSPAYDELRGDDLEDVLDAWSAQVDHTDVDDRTFIVTTVVPPLFRFVSLPATGMAGDYTEFQIEIIDQFDDHITSVDPSTNVVFTSYPASHQATGEFYRFDSGLGSYVALGQGVANTLQWDAQGYATIYYSDTQAGTAQLWVEDSSGAIKSSQKPITIVPAMPTGYPLPTLHADPTAIPGNGSSISNITSDPITDPYGNIIHGGTYTVEVDSGTIIAVDVDGNPGNGIQVVADSSGVISFSVRSAQTTGTATVSAYTMQGGPTAQVTVEYVAGVPSGTLALTPSVPEIAADGQSTVTVTSSVIADAWGNQVPEGTLITVSSTLGSITTPDADGGIAGIQTTVSAAGTVSFTVQAGALAGQCGITATSVAGSAQGTTAVSFIPGDPAGAIVLNAEPDAIVANAPNSSQITSQPITDGTNIVLDGSLFTVSAQRGTVVAIDQDTNLDGIQVASTDGVISFLFNPTTGTGIVRIEAASVQGTAYGFVDITLTGAGSVYGPITLHADPSVIPADGQSTTTITSDQLTDRYDNIIEAGTPLQVSTTAGTINDTGLSAATVPTQAGGILTFTIQSSTVAGQVTVTAQNDSGTSAGSVPVTFEPGAASGTIVLQANPASLVAKSGAQSVVRVPNANPIRDVFGNIVKDGTTVTVTTDRGKLLDGGSEVVSRTIATSGGLFSVTLRATADASVGTATVSASAGSAAGSASVSFIPGVPSGTILLSAQPGSIIADGSDTSVITSGQITDQYGTVVADGRLIDVSTDRGTLLTMDDSVISSPVAVSDGTISFKLRSSITTGTATINAVSAAGTASGSTTVTCVPGEPAGSITLTSVPASVIAKSGQTTAVSGSIIRDANGNAVGSGVDVTLTCSSGVLDDGQGTQASSITVQTNANSRVNATFVADSSTEPGTVSITADTVSGSAQTTQPLSIQLNADRPAGTITLLATPAQIVADGQSTSTIHTVDPVTDQYGNPVDAGTLVTVIPTWGTIVEPDADPVVYQNHQVAVDADGHLSFTLQSETRVGTSDISASSPTGTASGSVQVTGIPGPTARLVVVMPGETFDADEPDGRAGGPPDDQVINEPFDVTVYPVDEFGNRVFDATLEIELTPLSAYMQCTPSWVQSFDGVAGELTFTVEDTISGLGLSFTAQDTASGAITGAGNVFDIIAGQPVKVQIVLPGQTPVPGDSGDGITGIPTVQQAGVPFDVIVNYVDIYYNIVTGAQGTVELSSSGVGAVLPENTVLTNGSATMTVTETTFSIGANRVVTANIYPIGGGTPVSATSTPFEVTDTLAPQLMSFSINGAAEYTVTQSVTLSIEAVDAAGSDISMRFKNDDGAWGNYIAYQPELSGYEMSAGRGTKQVSVQLKDSFGNETAVYSQSIIYASPPQADAGSDYVAVEGSQVQLDASGTTDADPVDTLSYFWDISGDGEFDDATGIDPVIPFNDDYSGTIGLKVVDSYGLEDTDFVSITVSNVAPAITVPGEGQTLVRKVGEEIRIEPIAITDPGTADTHSATILWAPGVQETYPSVTGSFSAVHTYSSAGIFAVEITVTDDNGGSDVRYLTIDASHEPAADAGGDYTGYSEGDTITFDAGGSTDPDGLAGLVYEWDLNEDGTYELTGSVVTYTWNDDHSGQVSLRVTDPKGFFSVDTVTVDVANVAPVLSVDTGQLALAVAEGAEVSLENGVSFSDQGSGDEHTVTVDWGGQEGDDMIGTAPQGPVVLSHIYSDSGMYTVTVTVEDDDGDSDVQTFDVQVGLRPIDLAVNVEDDRNVKLQFASVPDKSYLILYCDNDSVLSDPTMHFWQTAATITGDSDVQTADIFIDAGAAERDHPADVAIRYYRVVRLDVLSQGGTTHQASSDIAYVCNVVLHEGRNFVGKTGDENTLAQLVDPRFLLGGLKMNNATVVNYMENGSFKQGYVFADTGTTNFWLNAEASQIIDDLVMPDGYGIMITLPPGTGSIILPKSGLIKTAAPAQPVPIAEGYTLLAWPYTCETPLSQSYLTESGFKGDIRARTADQIYFWNPQTQRYDLPVFYFTGTGEWRYYDQSACQRSLKPGEAVLIRKQPGSSFSEWNISGMPYPQPTSTLEE